MLRDKIRALGVEVLVEKATECIEDGEQARHRLRFKDGSHLETDVLLFSASAPDGLARQSGLAVGERGGICIDDGCHSSDPAILAIGECARWQGRIFGLVAPATRWPGPPWPACAAARAASRGRTCPPSSS